MIFLHVQGTLINACAHLSMSPRFLETVLAKGILDILNETDNSTDEELLEYAMTLINKVSVVYTVKWFSFKITEHGELKLTYCCTMDI